MTRCSVWWVGETLARHLNCVFIDEKDKEVDAVRQCLFRAMISSQQAPRWIFKDFELGWLEVDEDNVGEEVPPSRDGDEVVLKEEPVPVLYGWLNWVKDYFGPVFDVFTFLWSLVFTKEVKYVGSIVDDQVVPHDVARTIFTAQHHYPVIPYFLLCWTCLTVTLRGLKSSWLIKLELTRSWLCRSLKMRPLMDG